jgi:ABC-2 type transport system permease protein
MNKTFLIARYELVSTLSRRSFLLIAIGVPLLAILISAGAALLRDRPSANSEAESPAQTFHLDTEGYVDQSGLIKTLPPEIPSDHLVAYPDEEGAKGALEAGEISRYYLIPADFVATGEILYVYPDTVPLISDGQDWLIRRTLLINLMDGDMALAERIWNPMDQQIFNLGAEPAGGPTGDDCSRPGVGCQSNLLIRYLPAIMSVLLYVFLLTSSTLLLRNVGSEKENRTIEVLLVSITPRQMLAGKIIGLGIVCLLQTTLWVGTFFGLLTVGRGLLNLPDLFSVPLSILAWSLIFFLLGFAIYASLMAGVGALVPKLKEINQASFVAMAPLMVGYMVGLLAPLADLADGALPVALSLFPLTAPIVMVMRLTAGHVPLWQLLLSAGLMALTAYAIIRAVAAMFRAQHLLSGESFSLGRFFGALAAGARDELRQSQVG